MPMNESSGIRRSNLTKRQRLEAEAALYGYPMTNTEEKPLTQEEIEKMRALVSQHDRAAGITTEFDLNNPKSGVVDEQGKVQHYHYVGFPKTLYNHEKRTSITVKSQEEMDEKAKDGFVKEPFPPIGTPAHDFDMILGADNLPKTSVLDRETAPAGAPKPPTKGK